MSLVGALLAAQRRSFWNRLRRDSALGGPLATGLTFAAVGLLLVLPGIFALHLGRELGEELRAGSDPAALARWNAFQALFTVGFALLGSFRLRPAFDVEALASYPIPPFQLLLAELPAAMFEVFPLLGGASIVLMNVGLAGVLPWASPVIALLALQGLAAMLALLFLGATLWRWLLRRPWLAGALALTVAASAGWVGVAGLRTGLSLLVDRLPGSLGYRGLLALRAGDYLAGFPALLLALGATAAALVFAALAHRWERASSGDSALAVRRAPPPLRFGSPAGAVASLHFRLLLASQAGRLSLAIPVLIFGPFAAVLLLARSALAAGLELPAGQAGILSRLAAGPVLVWSLVAVVLLDSELWMNQFGWDRSGIRSLLQLPIAPEDLLRGKLLGLARFVALQALLCWLALLPVSRWQPAEAVQAVGGGVAAFIAVATAGQYFSLRFPRGVARDGTAHLPLHLSWIPAVIGVLVAGLLAGVAAIAAELAPWTPAVALIALGGGAARGYLFALPTLAKQVARHQEHLLRM